MYIYIHIYIYIYIYVYIYMSFGGSSEKLEKLLNAKNFQNRIINTQRVRLKNDHNCYSKNDPQTFLKN